MQCRAVMSQPFLGKCPPHAVETVQAIREAVAHSTCGPYTDIAVDDTLVINPPWADEPRTMVRHTRFVFQRLPYALRTSQIRDIVDTGCDSPLSLAESAPARAQCMRGTLCSMVSETARVGFATASCHWKITLQGLSDAVCGVDTDTKYAEEHVRPIAASYETDGSVFLLWERKAKYSDSSDGKQHSEDICGVTYVKKNNDGNASVIATFRQPTPVRASL